jgi:hypothetical protein
MDILEDLGLDVEGLISIIAIGTIEASTEAKTAHQTGLSGHQYLEELLSSSPKRIYGVLRMKKDTFYLLCDWLQHNTELRSTWRTTIQEQVAMFLWTINFSASQRQVMERFQHSAETVSRYCYSSLNIVYIS